jgi:hypothetical protein
LARVPDRRYADADALFAVTDLVAPGLFATPRDARRMQHEDREAFLQRRDAVVLRKAPSAGSPFSKRRESTLRAPGMVLAMLTVEGLQFARSLVTVAWDDTGATMLPGDELFLAACDAHVLDPTSPMLPSNARNAMLGDAQALTARHLTRVLARLANAYADRIDAAPVALRTTLAQEFSLRADLLVKHASLRVCIAPLASVTIPAVPAHATS